MEVQIENEIIELRWQLTKMAFGELCARARRCARACFLAEHLTRAAVPPCYLAADGRGAGSGISLAGSHRARDGLMNARSHALSFGSSSMSRVGRVSSGCSKRYGIMHVRPCKM